MGRPSKFNDALKETILRLYKKGRTDPQVAHIIGVSRRTINNWKRKHPDFLHALKEMKCVADDLVEASLFSRAVGYSHPDEKLYLIDNKIERAKTTKHYAPDTTAAIFWLKNRQPDKWRENYQFDVHDMDKKSDDELDQRILELVDKQKKGEKSG